MGAAWRAHCVIVDNGAPRQELLRVRTEAPETRVLSVGHNGGFARAVNVGIAHARAQSDDVVVTLNDDVTVDGDALDRLVVTLRANSHAGSAAGVLLQRDSDVVDTAGLRCDPALTAHDVGRGSLWKDDIKLPQPLGASAGLAAYRLAALAAIGDFDEGFFAYYEDLDVALRLRRAGWECVLVADAVGRHLGSSTLGWRSPAKAAVVGRSRGRVARKYGVHRRRRAWPWLVVEMLAGLGLAVELRSVAPVRERVAGFRGAEECLPYPDEFVDAPPFGRAIRDRLMRRYGTAGAATR